MPEWNQKWHGPTPNARTASRYVAIRGPAEHKTISMTAIHTEGLEPINGDDWELFTVSTQDDKHVWGMFVEGLGLIDVMVPLENVRDLTEAEKTYFSGKQMVMVGSHSGKVSYGWKLPDMSDDE